MITTADCLLAVRQAIRYHAAVIAEDGPHKQAFDWLACANWWLTRMREIIHQQDTRYTS